MVISLTSTEIEQKENSDRGFRVEDRNGRLELICLVQDNFRYIGRAVLAHLRYFSLILEFIICDQYLGKDNLRNKCNKNLFCSLSFQVTGSFSSFRC